MRWLPNRFLPSRKRHRDLADASTLFLATLLVACVAVLADYRTIGLSPLIAGFVAVCCMLFLWEIRNRDRDRRRKDRERFARRICVDCGYNLHGNTSGRCPECGKDMPDPVDVVAQRLVAMSTAPVPAEVNESPAPPRDLPKSDRPLTAGERWSSIACLILSMVCFAASVLGWYYSRYDDRIFAVIALMSLGMVPFWRSLNPYRLRRRRSYARLRSQCQYCGYDLRGNTTDTCPECGHHRPRRWTKPRNAYRISSTNRCKAGDGIAGSRLVRSTRSAAWSFSRNGPASRRGTLH